MPTPRLKPREQIDAVTLQKLAGIGCTIPEIATFFSCSEKTVKRHFGPELKNGYANLRMSIKRKQYEIAMKGNATLLIWIGKQYCNQADAFRVDEHSDDNKFEFVK